MNVYDRIRRFCRAFRIFFGIGLIGLGFYFGNYWFFLGVIPLIAGIVNFCPLCIITKKCTI